MTTKPAPKKKAAAQPEPDKPEERDRFRPQIMQKEFEVWASQNRSKLTIEEFTEMIDDLADVGKELAEHGIFVYGVLGKGEVRATLGEKDTANGPIKLAKLGMKWGSWAGGLDSGDYKGREDRQNYGCELARGRWDQ